MRAVLERDFLSEASRPRSVVFRTVLGAVVATVVCLLLLQGTGAYGSNPDTVGRAVFIGGSIALLVLLALMTPALVVGSILSERQGLTLSLVLATPVGARSFAAAKLLSRWGVTLLIAFAALPCLALTTLFGGVSGTQLEGIVVTSLALSLEMAAWSLWFSSISRRLATAAVLSFVAPLVRWILAGFMMGWIGSQDWATAAIGATFPIGPAAELIEPGTFAQLPGIPDTPALPWAGRLLLEQPWWAYLAFAALGAGAAVAAAGSRLKSESEPRESLLARTGKGRRWFRGRPPAGNPVTWKEVRLLNSASSRPLFYGVLAAQVLILVLCSKAVEDKEGILLLVAALTTLISFVAAVSGAAAFGHERAQGTYDLLRISLLTPGQIVRGKLAGVFVGLGFLASVPVGTALAGLLGGSAEPLVFVAILAAIAVGPGSWALIGSACAVLSKSPRAALVRTCSLFAILLVGLPLLGVLFGVIGSWSGKFEVYLFMASPPAATWGFLDWVHELQAPQREFFDFSKEMRAGLWSEAAMAVLGIVLLLLLSRLLARRLDRDREAG